jgi:hypothetical protein
MFFFNHKGRKGKTQRNTEGMLHDLTGNLRSFKNFVNLNMGDVVGDLSANHTARDLSITHSTVSAAILDAYRAEGYSLQIYEV